MTHGLPGDPGAAAPEVTVLSSREVYRTPWIGVREDRIVQHGVPLTFSVIEMKAGVTVLPLDDAGQVHLVSEYKYGIGRQSLELVSGGVEAEEDLLDAARRELVEETGLLASEWEYLGRLDPFTTAVHARTTSSWPPG